MMTIAKMRIKKKHKFEKETKKKNISNLGTNRISPLEIQLLDMM